MVNKRDDTVLAGRAGRAARLQTRLISGVVRLDAASLIATSWFLSLVAIWVVQQVHFGVHEHHELPPILHLVRDAALAVPLAAISIAISALATGGRIGALDRGARQVLIAGLVFAALSVPGSQLHGSLFVANQEFTSGGLAHVLFDGSFALAGALLALIPLAVMSGLAGRRPEDRAAGGTGSASSIYLPIEARPVSDVSARSTR